MIIVIICAAVVIWGFFEIIKRVAEQNRRNEEIDREEKRRNVNQTLQQQMPHSKTYEKKKLMTATEIKFFHAIKDSTPKGYVVLPQINLATIINRSDDHKYQNELFRNIDFVVFDLETNPIVLIEINDNSHKEKDRWIRDKKVESICREADLPIITLWTDYGINSEYIKKRIEEYCKISA